MTTQTKPCFTILDKNKKKPDTLIHCFIEKMVISTSFLPGTMTASNGAEYESVYDSFVLDDTATTQKIIVSFQKHTYGKYAVIRNFKNKQGT